MTQYVVVTHIGTYDVGVHAYDTLEEALEWYWLTSEWTKPILAQVIEMVPNLPGEHLEVISSEQKGQTQ